MLNYRIGQWPTRRAGHSLGEVLIVKRRKCLAAAPAGPELGFEGAFVHLLKESAEEGLADPFLGGVEELFIRWIDCGFD